MKLLKIFQNINLNKKKKNFISSFIGTLIFGIGGMASMMISSYSVYITSYFHYKKINVNMQYGNLIMPIVTLSHSLFSPLAGYIENKIGLYLTLILSSFFLELDIFLFINQTNILFSLVLIIFLGFSNGIGMAIPGKNLFFYYPKKSGIISSLMGSSFILLGTAISVIGEKIINPEKYTLVKGEQFYPFEISKNYKKFYKYVLLANPLILILALLLIKKYNPEQYDELLEENNKNNKENILPNFKKDENYLKNIKFAIMNKRTLKLIGITILTPFVMGFSGNTFRVYGALVSISGTIMQYSQLFTGFSNVFVGPIWGYINDKYKYEIIIKILCGSCIFQATILFLFIKSNNIYIFCIVFGSIIMSGFMSANQLHTLRVYGIKYSLEIGGVIGIFSGIFNIFNALLSFTISKYYHTGEELQSAYRIIYLIGIGVCSIGFYFAFHEKEDKFIYPFSPTSKVDEYSPMMNSDFSEKDKDVKIVNEFKEIELELESNNSETLDSSKYQ